MTEARMSKTSRSQAPPPTITLGSPFGLPHLLLIILLGFLSGQGCTEYRLSGTVATGRLPAVLVVDNDDPRLNQLGVEGAVIELTLDPRSLRPRSLGAGQTDGTGQFDIPIDQAGAGVLDYQLGILCRLEGHQSIWQIVPMPSTKRRLLIMMAPGHNRHSPTGNRLNEVLKIQQRLLREPR